MATCQHARERHATDMQLTALASTPRGARDAALRRLLRAKRWLLVGTATLTGELAAVAASAFPGAVYIARARPP